MTNAFGRHTLGVWGLCLSAMVLLGGCAGRSRVILVDTPAAARAACDLTARQWGFRFLHVKDGRVVYHSAGLSGPSTERLRLWLDHIARHEVRVSAQFTGSSAGLEKVFLADVQKNISNGTILPVAPAR